ncbi:MAG: VRR-NUC domain-containing protein [Bergeyella sp.]|nr:VRR-NUC domain-containing protein [Bergeyella sp.]
MEKQTEKYLVTRVKNLGGLCVKYPPLFFRGFPDRIVLLPGGAVVFVEIKARGEKPRLIQRKVHARLRALGFRVEVVDSAGAVDAVILAL